MHRYRAVVVTCATLVATIVLVLSLPLSRTPPPPSVSTLASGSAPTPARAVLHSSGGFDLEIPDGWLGKIDERGTNRSIHRLILAGNRGLEAPDLAISDWAGVPSDRVIVELVEYFGGPPGIPPKTTNSETLLPLDWRDAQLAGPQGQFALWSLGFTHLGRSLGFRVHVGPDAPAADLALLSTLVASLRPEPIPATGDYRGWRVLGPLDAYPVGTVAHFDPAPPNAYGFFLVRGKTTIFAHIDRAFVSYGGFASCAVRYDSASRSFACDRSDDRWSRLGTYLTGGQSLALSYHPVLIKDGLVLVGGSTIRGWAWGDDEAAEFTDIAKQPAQRSRPFTRAEIVTRFGKVTAVDPIERSAAKLVPADLLAQTGVFGGAALPAPRVWVVALGGPVHSPQGDASQTFGAWALYAADPWTGNVLSSNCCGQANWPPVFDELPDLAR